MINDRILWSLSKEDAINLVPEAKNFDETDWNKVRTAIGFGFEGCWVEVLETSIRDQLEELSSKKS